MKAADLPNEALFAVFLPADLLFFTISYPFYRNFFKISFVLVDSFHVFVLREIGSFSHSRYYAIKKTFYTKQNLIKKYNALDIKLASGV